MSASSNQWYVEMSAGITLGPMPFDDLVELAETSALMRNDRVRQESADTWQPACEIRGLFPAAEPDVSVGNVVSLAAYEVRDSVTKDAAARAAPKRKAPKEKRKKKKRSTTEPVSSQGKVVRLSDFEVQSGNEDLSVGGLGQNSGRRRVAAVQKPARTDVAIPLPLDSLRRSVRSEHGSSGKSVQNLQAASVEADSLAKKSPDLASCSDRDRVIEHRDALAGTESLEKLRADDELATTAPILDDRTALDDSADAVSATVQVPVKPWTPPVDRRLQVLKATGTLAGVVVVVWTLWWVWRPDVEQVTYSRYAALYEEYQSVNTASDENRWSEFTTRAKAELDESIPLLEVEAVPGERSKSLLLYAGRDLRTALDLNVGTDNPHAERLAGFFEQLNELHASTE